MDRDPARRARRARAERSWSGWPCAFRVWVNGATNAPLQPSRRRSRNSSWRRRRESSSETCAIGTSGRRVPAKSAIHSGCRRAVRERQLGVLENRTPQGRSSDRTLRSRFSCASSSIRSPASPRRTAWTSRSAAPATASPWDRPSRRGRPSPARLRSDGLPPISRDLEARRRRRGSGSAIAIRSSGTSPQRSAARARARRRRSCRRTGKRTIS